jgi:hypothetical protein
MTDTPAQDALLSLFAWVRRELDGLIRMLGDPAALDAIASDLGLRPVAGATAAAQAAQSKLLKGDDPELQALESTIESVIDVVSAIESVGQAIVASDSSMTADDFLSGVLRLYAARTIRFRSPGMWATAKLLGFVVSEDIMFENIAKFINQTGPYLSGITAATDDERKIDNTSLLLGVAGAAVLFGTPKSLRHALSPDVLYGWDSDPASATPNADNVLKRALSLQLNFAQDLADGVKTTESVTLTSILVPAEHHSGHAGYFGALTGRASVTFPLGSGWDLKLGLAGGDVLQFFIGEHPEIQVPTGQGGTAPADLALTVTLERPDDDSGVWHLGDLTSTHLEIGKATLAGTVGTAATGVLGATKDTALVIAAPSGDGFLAKVLPPGGIRLQADVGLGIDTTRGFYIDGGTQLEATVPINKTVFGFQVQQLTIALAAAAQQGTATFGLELSGAFGLTIGGVLSASVDRIGIKLELDVPANGKTTLQPKFSPPKGVGIMVNATAVKGGGYLYFDPDKGEYAGVAELKIGPVDVKAIGLLTTKLPDGSPGFSLLLVLSVEFSPALQLSFGFTLNGVGGLIGIHHAMDTGKLQSGLKDHTLDLILFPADPVGTAPRILTTMRAVFPVNPSRFVFGPLLKLGWGAPVSLVTLTLGVVLDLPAPVRLVILGQLRMILPSDQEKLVQLHADILGVIDFDQGTVSVDVSLSDSKITTFAISGDIAIRVKVGSGGYFLFSAGGFNPKYKPVPDGLGSMKRLAIDISGGPNPKLRLEAYLALTSNSFQIGARLDLYAAAGPFSVEGYLGFDALVVWDPKFHFTVEITAGVALKYNGDSLFAITLDLLLEGPAPWHAKGTGSFSILFWDVSFAVEARWGDPDTSAPPPSVNVTARIVEELSKPGNWNGALPADGDRIVTLASRPADGLLVHPLGELVAKQTVAPIGLHLDRIGSSPVAGPDLVTLGVPAFQRAGGGAAPATASAPVTDSFAPGQFLDLSEDEKLTRPAFETMQAGLTIATASVLFGAPTETDTTYETVIVRQQQSTRPPGLYHLPLSIAAVVAEHGAAGRAVIRSGGRYAAAANPVRVGSPDDVLAASRHDLSAAPGGLAATATFALAKQALAAFEQANPDQAGRFQLVSPHEVAS